MGLFEVGLRSQMACVNSRLLAAYGDLDVVLAWTVYVLFYLQAIFSYNVIKAKALDSVRVWKLFVIKNIYIEE